MIGIILLFSTGVIPSMDYMVMMAQHGAFDPPEAAGGLDRDRFIRHCDNETEEFPDYLEIVDILSQNGTVNVLDRKEIYDVSDMSSESADYFLTEVLGPREQLQSEWNSHLDISLNYDKKKTAGCM